MSGMLQGIAASEGIAVGRALVLEAVKHTVKKRSALGAEEEWQRYLHAVKQSEAELEQIRAQAQQTMGEAHAQIFTAHLLVLHDPELTAQVHAKIVSENADAAFALQEAASGFAEIFDRMENTYMRARAADIRDVTDRVLRHLTDAASQNLKDLDAPVILVADDLTPSETAQLCPNTVLGFVTNIGGRTSHTAIMSRTLELPAVVGTHEATRRIQTGDWLILDGLTGRVYIRPNAEQITSYEEKRQTYIQQRAEWQKLKNVQTVTADGHTVALMANIGSPADLEAVLANGAEGVGLFRTEFLYMGKSHIPSEEEQLSSYRRVLETLAPKPVVIRTLDIGGDKSLPYFDMPQELNPFLGFRATRLVLSNPQLFRPQLRALLRASVYGNLKIMFPMIATLEEFRQAKQMLLEEKTSLKQAGHAVSDEIEIGLMVEIPAAALCADLLAKEADFMSIGTNDLIQYTMAADRMNEQVAYLYQPFHPSVLRLILHVTEAAHKEGKWVGICGEMAGDHAAIPLLLKLGLDEFSMSANRILPARDLIRRLRLDEFHLSEPLQTLKESGKK